MAVVIVAFSWWASSRNDGVPRPTPTGPAVSQTAGSRAGEPVNQQIAELNASLNAAANQQMAELKARLNSAGGSSKASMSTAKGPGHSGFAYALSLPAVSKVRVNGQEFQILAVRLEPRGGDSDLLSFLIRMTDAPGLATFSRMTPSSWFLPKGQRRRCPD